MIEAEIWTKIQVAKIVTINGVGFSHSLSAQSLNLALKRVADANCRAKALDCALKAAVTEKDEAAATLATQAIFEDPESVLASRITTNLLLPPSRREVLEVCLSPLPDIGTPIPESVLVRSKMKKNGEPRPYCAFGPIHQTAQRLVLRVLSPRHKPRPFQFDHLGVHKAIAAVKGHLTSGYVHVAKLDIKNCFGSFDEKKLASELPLPPGTVEHVVMGRHMKVTLDQASGHTPDPQHTHLLHQARLGIAPGSRCSPIVAARCLARLPWSPPAGVAMVNYVDDFLLLGTSSVLAVEAMVGLTEAVAALPGGHFTLKLILKRHASKAFEFLGHELTLTPGGLVVKPGHHAWDRLLKKLTEIEEQLSLSAYHMGKVDHAKSVHLLKRMNAYVVAWGQAFRECSDIARYLSLPKMEIAYHAKLLDVSLDQIETAEAWVKAEIDDYFRFEGVSGHA